MISYCDCEGKTKDQQFMIEKYTEAGGFTGPGTVTGLGTVYPFQGIMLPMSMLSQPTPEVRLKLNIGAALEASDSVGARASPDDTGASDGNGQSDTSDADGGGGGGCFIGTVANSLWR